MIEFRTSQEAVERMRQRFKIMRIFIQVTFTGLALFITVISLKLLGFQRSFSFTNIFIFLIPVSVIVLAFALPKFQNAPLKKLKSQRIRLLSQRVERHIGADIETLNYDDVVGLQVSRDSSAKLVALTLNSRRMNMQLDSLEHMDALLEGLRAVLPDVPETEKKQRISTETNRNFFLVMVAAAVIGILAHFALKRINANLSDIFVALLFLFPAVFVLTRRPTSNSVQSATAARRQNVTSLLLGLTLLGMTIWQIFF